MGAIASGGVRVLNDDVSLAGHSRRSDRSGRRAEEPSWSAGRRPIAASGRRPDRGPSRDPRRRRPGYRLDDARRGARRFGSASRRGIVVAVPVGAASTCAEMRDEVDEVVCPRRRSRSRRRRSGTRTSRRRATTRCAAARGGGRAAAGVANARRSGTGGRGSREARRAGPIRRRRLIDLDGDQARGAWPRPGARASSCSPTAAAAAGTARATATSPRCCSDAGLGTLLIDLLTAEEERGRRAHRAPAVRHRPAGPRGWSAATDWLAEQDRRRALPLGYFGASTGAGGGAGGGGGAARKRRRGRLARRPARPGRDPRCARRPRPDAADRRRRRRAGDRAEPRRRSRSSAARSELQIVARRDAPVRGAGRARRGRAAGAGLWFERHLEPPEREPAAEEEET